MRVFAFPVTLAPTGQLATVDQDSDANLSQAIALLLTTRYGEQILTPGYGTPDPVFSGVDATQLASAAAAFLPEVTITDVQATARNVREQDVTVRWSQAQES